MAETHAERTTKNEEQCGSALELELTTMFLKTPLNCNTAVLHLLLEHLHQLAGLSK